MTIVLCTFCRRLCQSLKFLSTGRCISLTTAGVFAVYFTSKMVEQTKQLTDISSCSFGGGHSAVDIMPSGIMELVAAFLRWITSWHRVHVPGYRSQNNLDRSSICQSTPNPIWLILLFTGQRRTNPP